MKYTTTIKSCFLLFFLIINSVWSQQEYMTGKVLDAKTADPIVFAAIRVKGRALGIITNEDGSFRIPMRYKEYGDVIEVSSMGYQSIEVAIDSLLTNDLNILRLEPGIVELDETIVVGKRKRKRALNARQIVKKAIEAIPKNYPDTPFSTLGYYRDYQKNKNDYVNLNEAILEVFDEGFDEFDYETTKTRLYDYKKNMDFLRDTLADNPYSYGDVSKIMNNAYLPSYGGNEFVILRIHNAIRNYRTNSFDFINNMSKGQFLKNQLFEKREDTFTEEENLYTIKIKRTEPSFMVTGNIFIAKNDYAIYKLEYAIYDNRKKNNDLLLQQRGIKGTLLFEVKVAYARGAKDKMYLNYISFHNTFKLAKPSSFKIKELTILPDKGAFVLRFNNPLAYINPTLRDIDRKVDKRKWYDFNFDNKKIKFDKIQVANNKTVFLYPKMDAVQLKNMMNTLVNMKKQKQDIGQILKFTVSGLQDVEGNSLNTMGYTDYHQFREFFVQEVKLGPFNLSDGLFMDNTKPIFEDQPIVKPANFADYWMNTPLQKNLN